MVNLGKKDSMGTEVASKSQKNKIWYPSFHVSDIDLGLGEEDVGKELTATVRLKVNSAGMRMSTDGKETKKTHDYSVDVLGIEFKGIKGNKPNSDWSVNDIMEHRKKQK